MATVCNSIIPQLIVSTPGNCAQFTENQSYSASCGAGTATDYCSLTISGGVAPYNTTFSYPVIPTATGVTLNMASFTGGSGASPQFGYSFTGSNMCSLSITGNLQVNYTVSDNSGQVVTGSLTFPVSINRYVTSGGGGGGGGGGCVTVASFIEGFGRASNVTVGSTMSVIDPVSFERSNGIVTVARVEQQPTVRITTKSGYSLECSTTAPIAVQGGEGVLPQDLLGMQVPLVVKGDIFFEEVTDVTDLGVQDVMYITCENNYFLAGAEDDAYFLHHNLKMNDNREEK